MYLSESEILEMKHNLRQVFAHQKTISSHLNFSGAIGSTDSRCTKPKTIWIQSKHDVEILSNHNKATKVVYDSPISTRVRRPCEMLANCEFSLHGVRNSRFQFNIQLEQQQQRDDNLLFANLHSCPQSVRTACELRISSSWK